MYVLLKILMIIGYYYEIELFYRFMKIIVIWNMDGKIVIEKKIVFLYNDDCLMMFYVIRI